MRVYAVLLCSTALLSAGAPGDCKTPLGVPCMTVELVDEQWSVLQRGIDYHHSRTHRQLAYASDGSIAHQSRFENIPLIGAVETFAPAAGLYLGPSDRVVRIMHADRKFSRREPIIWHDRPYRRARPNDATCASGILHSGTDFKMTGEQTILGTNTFRWYRPFENGGYEEQFLAPVLDCIALRVERVRKNLLRIPVFTDRSEVKAIRFGEPDPTLFQVPAGYQEVPDPSEERLRQFVKGNR